MAIGFAFCSCLKRFCTSPAFVCKRSHSPGQCQCMRSNLRWRRRSTLCGCTGPVDLALLSHLATNKTPCNGTASSARLRTESGRASRGIQDTRLQSCLQRVTPRDPGTPSRPLGFVGEPGAPLLHAEAVWASFPSMRYGKGLSGSPILIMIADLRILLWPRGLLAFAKLLSRLHWLPSTAHLFPPGPVWPITR